MVKVLFHHPQNLRNSQRIHVCKLPSQQSPKKTFLLYQYDVF